MNHDFIITPVLNAEGIIINTVIKCIDCAKTFTSRRAAQMHKNMMKRWHGDKNVQ